MYTEVILRPQKLVGKRIYGDEARHIIARVLLDKKVSPALFSRGEDGKTLGKRINKQSPVSSVVFDGGNGFLRLYGVGKFGSEVLKSELSNIVSGLSASYGSVIMELKEGEVAFKSGFGVYKIGKLGVAKHAKKRGEIFFDILNRYNNADVEKKDAVFAEAVDMIKTIIDRDVAGQGEQLGLMIPRNLNIDVLGGTLGLSQIHKDFPGHVGVVRNLRFSVAANLVGPWSVGHLRSMGYGLIRREIVK